MFEEEMSIQDSIAEAQHQHRLNRMQQRAHARQIEPQQNWLAKLFHVKPASRFICFSISKRSARQEVTKVLKDWKRYGIRDVQVDKQRNIVFGRVGAENCK
jgi:serine/threonine-protein kinase HSL1 (negative regulator of Swe1 kinase)